MFIAASDIRPAGEAGDVIVRTGRPAVLVADDAPEVVTLLQDSFGGDYDVLVARDGGEALAIASAHQPELVLLSVELPGRDGFDVCRTLKADVRTRDIPVIFVSGGESDETEIRGLELGAIDFLTRPVRPIPLALRVGNHLALKRTRDTVLGQAILDAPTGVGNRRLFEDSLAKEWSRSIRLRTHLSLALIDLDHFPRFVRNNGAAAGDACLRRVADLLKGALFRPTDLIARYGRERFALLLPQTDAPGSRHVAERAREAVERAALAIGGDAPGLSVTLSVGLATALPAGGEDPVTLLRLADERATEARDLGRNRVH